MENFNNYHMYPGMDDHQFMPYPAPPMMGHMPAIQPGCPPMMPGHGMPPYQPPMMGHMPHPPMPIGDYDAHTHDHLKKMYYTHLYMASMHKAEAYKHKMMYYDYDHHDHHGHHDYDDDHHPRDKYDDC